MIRSQKPEGPGEGKGHHRWTYNPVECKSAHRGFKAGDPFGAYVHYDKGKSVPCAEKLTNKALACPYCERGLVPDWRGYTPYYDEDYVRKFALITFQYHESVCEIAHLAPIVLRRGKSKTDPVVIRQENWRTTPIPASRDRDEPADLGEFLVLVLWQHEALRKWALAQPRTPVEKEPTPKPAKGKAKGDMYQGANKLVNRALNEQAIDEPLHKVFKRLSSLGTPSTNGDHTKTEGKGE